jgi:hypothetical protein
LSLLTVSTSHTRQHCLRARVTATFIRLWSLKNPTWKNRRHIDSVDIEKLCLRQVDNSHCVWIRW